MKNINKPFFKKGDKVLVDDLYLAEIIQIKDRRLDDAYTDDIKLGNYNFIIEIIKGNNRLYKKNQFMICV